MTYEAEQTLQATGWGQPQNPGVWGRRVHEDRGDGTPLCGTPARERASLPMAYVPTGPGTVTCLRCALVRDPTQN